MMGRQVGNGTARTGPIDYDFPDNDLFIGHYNNCPALDFHGQVDAAQIYNRALSASDVGAEYSQFANRVAAAHLAARFRVVRRPLRQAAEYPPGPEARRHHPQALDRAASRARRPPRSPVCPTASRT